MKRDDRISPLHGGNEVRRYEFMLGGAQAGGKTRIVTAGGIASTQARASPRSRSCARPAWAHAPAASTRASTAR
jgi:hypothetical protein